MAAQSERVLPDADQDERRPIELLTENGFSIFRRWEVEGTPVPAGGEYEFLVRDPNGDERQMLVEIGHQLVTRIEIHTCGRIVSSNSFWIWCAERHLAAHVSEHGECPADGQLRVQTLTPADLNLSIRWERT